MSEKKTSAKKPNTTPTVVKANALIQAGFRLTIAEQRVLLSAIAQVRRDEALTDQIRYSVTANALCDVAGMSARQAYNDLAAAAERLYQREVRIEGGPNGERGKRYLMTRWVQSVEYVKDQGRVELRFAHDILPYLTLLKTEFTKYKLEYVSKMRSTYGIRLYELLQQWRQIGEREIPIDALRSMFGIDESLYTRINDLKKRVIEPAVDDVNRFSDLTVTWAQKKSGRCVTAFQFIFQPKGPEPDAAQKKMITRDEAAKTAKVGETWEQLRARLQKEGVFIGA